MTALPSLLSPTLAPTAAPASARTPRQPEPARGFAQALGAARDGAPRGRDAARAGAEPPVEKPGPEAAAPASDDGDTNRADDANEASSADPARAPAPAAEAAKPTDRPTDDVKRGAAWPLPADGTGPRAAPVVAGSPRSALADTTLAAERPAAREALGTADPLAAAGRVPLARAAAGAAQGQGAASPRLMPAGERPDPAAPQAGVVATSASASTAVALPGTAVEAVGSAAASRTPDGAGFAAALAAAVSSSAPAPAAPTAEAAIAAPPGSPAFAGEIAAQVSTFVRDGVQEAQLHLNPAEMGPVEVRIQLEGDAARVVLAAEQAPTRQWLEQALPTLAGSLREAGLTLAGGGVFERAPGGDLGNGSGNGSGTPGQGRGSADGTADGTRVADSPRAAAPRRRGVVDLVA
jgi:flagellar hook-length control protein FliK